MGLFAALTIGSALVGAFGKKKAGDATAATAKMNAKLIKKRTEIQATISERKAIKGIGATKADVGSAGLLLAGSAGDIVREGQRDAAFELKTIKEQGALEAKIARKGGQAAKTAGNIGAAGSIIGGVARAFAPGG